MILDVEDAGGLVGALEELADIHELVSLASREGGGGDALEEMGVFLDLLVELVRAALPDLAGILRLQEEVALVERLEHLQRDLVAHLPGILAGREEAGDDRIGVLFPEGEELRHVLAVGPLVEPEEGLLVACRAEDREPVLLELLVVEIGEVEHQLQVHVEQTRDVLRALYVAAHPVEGVGDAREHHLGVAPVADRLLGRGNGSVKIAHGPESERPLRNPRRGPRCPSILPPGRSSPPAIPCGGPRG